VAGVPDTLSLVTATADQGDAGGAKAWEPSTLVGRVISARYKIVSLLGEGGMGAVYLAEHVHMRKRLALKVLHPEMMEREEIVARFEREAMAAAHIDHPNVAQATDFGRTEDGAFFLVLEYIEGKTLRTVLREQSMDAARTVRIAKQIASALSRAHEVGIVHRDLKPENIMLVDRGPGSRSHPSLSSLEEDFVKVLDFGIAKVQVETLGRGGAGAVLTRAGTIFGTPEYMAPEQALGESVDRRADLYALGVMMYEMLAGRLPFEAGDMVSLLARQIAESAPPLRVMAPERNIAPELEAIVMKLLEKQASLRYDTAAELSAALDGIAVQSSPMMPMPVESVSGIGSLPTAVAISMPSEPRLQPASAGLPLPAKYRRYVPAVVVALLGGAVMTGGIMIVGAVYHAVTRPAGEADGGVVTEIVNTVTAKKPSGLPPEKLDAAAREGPEALEKLAQEFPDDARIYRALFVAHGSGIEGQGNVPSAMRAVARLLTADPKAASEPEILAAVVVASASPHLDAQEAAMNVLEGPLGARGADILYDLSNRPISRASKARYLASLSKPEVLAHASPALTVLMDLKAAKKCEAKKELLPRAKEHGDARMLVQLELLQKTRGCGFLGRRDCWSCLHDDRELDDAAAAVQRRLSGP
jgi:serine/threonine protein kinase